jgi:formamidopyrimidine-DNA glycosylase
MEGARFVRVLLRRPDLRTPFPVRFAVRLRGRTVRRLERRAKYLLAVLSSDETLVVHLGMSGSFRVTKRGGRLQATKRGGRLQADLGPAKAGPHEDGSHEDGSHEDGPHDHVVFHMSSGFRITFTDPRRFGFMDLLTPHQLAEHPALSRVGPEPLSSAFDAAALARACRGKKTSLKAALLDQRVVAGLGNIYASEALHLARLSPLRQASTIATASGAPRPAAVRLAAAIKQVLEQAIARSATADRRGDRFRVYDRAGAPCRRANCRGTIAHLTQSGRTSYYCPTCQR